MNVQEELKQLIQKQVLPDIEDTIDMIFEEINEQKDASSEARREIEELREFREDLEALLDEMENGSVDDEECKELLEDIKGAIEEGSKLE